MVFYYTPYPLVGFLLTIMPLWKMGLLFLPFHFSFNSSLLWEAGGLLAFDGPREQTRNGDTRMSLLLAGICHPVGRMVALDYLGFQ